MRILLLLGLLAAASGMEERTFGPYSDIDSVFFKGELDKFTEEFHTKLREKVTALREEMIIEFLEVVQQVDSSKKHISEDLSSKLEKLIEEVLGKFSKVMKYSATQIERINADIVTVLGRVGISSEGSLDPLLASEDNVDNYIDRRRRGAASLEGNKELSKPLEEVVDAKTLSKFDTTDIPPKEEQMLAAIIDAPDYFDGHIESHESDFVLWSQTSPRNRNQYQVVIQRPEKEEILPLEDSRKDDKPSNCYDLLQSGNTQDGVYRIFPQGEAVEGVEAWCDQTTDGGGWTHVLRRQPGHNEEELNFTRTAEEYIKGFGTALEEHWLGLENLHRLTTKGTFTLRVHLTDSYLTPSVATYYTFRIGDQTDAYRLIVTDYDKTSTAGDALSPHSGMPFSFPPTEGAANHTDEGCSSTYGVGWWYLPSPECYTALPMGLRRPQGEKEALESAETTRKGTLEWWPQLEDEDNSLEDDVTYSTMVLMTRPVLQ